MRTRARWPWWLATACCSSRILSFIEVVGARVWWLSLVLAACGSNNPPGGEDAGECSGIASRTLEQIYPHYFDTAAPTDCVAGCHGTGIGKLIG